MIRTLYLPSTISPFLLPGPHFLLQNSHWIPYFTGGFVIHKVLFPSQLDLGRASCLIGEMWIHHLRCARRIHCGSHLLKLIGKLTSSLWHAKLQKCEASFILYVCGFTILKSNERHQFIEFSLNNPNFLVFREYYQAHLVSSLVFKLRNKDQQIQPMIVNT